MHGMVDRVETRAVEGDAEHAGAGRSKDNGEGGSEIGHAAIFT